MKEASEKITSKSWRFYGREKEKDKLMRMLGYDIPAADRLFSTHWIKGRRGVGKTELIREVMACSPPHIPVVYHQMNEVSPVSYTLAEMNSDLLEAAAQNGLPNITQILPPFIPGRDIRHFKNILTTLWRQGAVVVLDEFHHATGTGIPSALKDIIDIAVGGWGDYGKKHPGKLVLMGSHQQRVDALFAPDQPLYGLWNGILPLEPWSLQTVMAMAADHGILANPAKFLTLWTAYDGMPRNWRRYCMDESHAHLHGISDETMWRQEWLRVEQQLLLAGDRERFDDRAFIELQPEHRDLFIWFGKRHPRGLQLGQIPGRFGNAPAKMALLTFLKERVGLVEKNAPYGKEDEPRWRISDNNTLFQLSVFPEMWKNVPKEDSPLPEDDEHQVTQARLIKLEGTALEQMGSQYLKEFPPAKSLTRAGAWSPLVRGDVDVFALGKEEGIRTFWLGNAKRNPKAHNTVGIKDVYKEFLAAIGEQETRCRYMLISPYFDILTRDKLKNEAPGYDIIDIHDMARDLGVDVTPTTKLGHSGEQEPRKPSPSGMKP